MAKRSRFYVWMAVTMVVITFWGFAETYFAPLFSDESAFGGQVSDLPFIVHLHGWSFFLWYLLVLFQAALIARAKRALHRRIGLFSIALAAVMTITGLIIIPVNIYNEATMEGPPIWTLFGPAILSILFLFLAFYALALRHRTRPALHKRYMILAGIPALGAAVFRIFLSLLGPKMLNIPAGILVTNALIVAAMLHDRRSEGKVHKVYWVGITVCVGVELLLFALPHTALGKAVNGALATIGGKLLFLYS